jgi:acyl-CoA thioester hydrolase
MQLRKRAAVSLRHVQRLSRSLQRPEHLSDYPLITSEKLRFADTDRNGHVSNAVFAVCCQNARMELLSDSERLAVPPDARFVLGRLDLEFRREMHWPGTVEVGTRVVKVGRCSVDLAQALFVGTTCVAVARSTAILIATDTRRSAPLSPELAQQLLTYAAAPKGTASVTQLAHLALRRWAASA